MDQREFFSEATEAQRYKLTEVIGKGSYGVVASAVDQFTGEKVAIKKITSVFDHVSDATRILREIKLLRLLRHPDIVEIKHIMLPPSARDFKDIYVVFELMETDLHQVIKANDDLTPEHHQFFLYQMLRGLKYIHSAKVFHRDLKPKNILANSDCKLKICDFGLARPAFNDMPQTVFWTDYVATRWYRAPELCGSFFAKYSPAIDIWSIGCIFAEILLGKPLFPGRNVVHQLELITDLLGTPSPEVIAKVRNEKARRFLMNMRKKPGVPFEQHFPKADKGALRLLWRLLAFDPAERPTAEEALADAYFAGLSQPSREPSAQPISKLAFEFERRKLVVEEVRELIYREILEYHPQMLADFLAGGHRQPNFVYPSAVDNFKRQFAHLEAGGRGQANPNLGQATSLPRERVSEFRSEAAKYLAAQRGGTQHMSGVAGASAYHAMVPPGPGGAGPPAYPYGSSVDMEGAVELLGSSVEKMSMIDAHSGFPTDAAGFMVHQSKPPPPPTAYPGAVPGYGGPAGANKHMQPGAYQQQQQQNLIRSNSAV
ncbi:Mitogen-activated kinase 17 [Micractinium conductrix]|uniref:mitogen-activated protein kinase n=1 Tax=Micractinium conductrix TaxID=554055 RepID=A0A2P6VCE0_9CHLO|nr:Mitogen-activated kinase 17 [Micractinium conductrix]|eukprot:PSC71749.1 Mitogen-activated kinase 17 [Micractinium conductrix]